MTGRASVFANAEVVKLAKERFVTVAGDDWYQRRRDDAEGRFFRAVADQGPRKGAGGGTRQGIYFFTADGELLGYRNHHDPEVMRQELRKALRVWDGLPADRRRPGAVTVADEGEPDRRYHREPPEGGLVLNVFTRVLDREDGELCKGTSSRPGGAFAARDRLWVTRAEWKSLVIGTRREGDVFDVPASLRDRILRYHLVDNTRGEPPLWAASEIRSRRMTLTVTESSPGRLRFRLEGDALLATSADADEADRGFDTALLGWIDYDREAGAIIRFDVAAVGDHWGEGRYTRGARAGRSPLGIAFELARVDDPAREVPPQGARQFEYLTGR